MRGRATAEYLWIWGGGLVVLGVASLVVHPDFAVGGGVTAKKVFGAFETNGWHGLAGLSVGAVALVSVVTKQRMREAALVVAGVGGVVPAFAFFISGDGSAALGLIPVDVADAVTLHLVPGLVGLGAVAVDMGRQPAPAVGPGDSGRSAEPEDPSG